ncbi:MAG: hypothetical protein ABR543_07815 [Gemmatimonadaceae bacterium]
MGQGLGSAHRVTHGERLDLQRRVRAGETNAAAAISIGCCAKVRATLASEDGLGEAADDAAVRFAAVVAGARRDFARAPGGGLLSSDRQAIGSLPVDRVA